MPHDEHQRLQELIDACRGDSDDLLDPELHVLADALAADPLVREQFEQAQQWDRELQELLDDAPPAPDLAQRLLQQVGAAQPQTVSKRRRWLTVSLSLVAAASLLFFALWMRPGRLLDADAVASEAAQWLAELDEQGNWETSAAPDTYPLDPAVRLSPTSTWKRFRQGRGHDPNAVIYRDRQASGVFLIALKSQRVAQLPDVPPMQPQVATGKYRIGVWQRNGLTYILAVRGEVEEYQRHLVRGLTA